VILVAKETSLCISVPIMTGPWHRHDEDRVLGVKTDKMDNLVIELNKPIIALRRLTSYVEQEKDTVASFLPVRGHQGR